MSEASNTPSVPNNTGSANHTIYVEDGEQVFPCRCGETHRGDYGAYDYGHHNCFHRAVLHDIGWPDAPLRSYLMCPDCGEVFHVEDAREQEAEAELLSTHLGTFALEVIELAKRLHGNYRAVAAWDAKHGGVPEGSHGRRLCSALVAFEEAAMERKNARDA